MRKLILIILIVITPLVSQERTFRIWGVTEDGDFSTQLYFGFDPEATGSQDKEWETELFPAEPPGGYGIHMMTTFFDSTQGENIFSYADITNKRDDPFYYEHNFIVFLDGGRKFDLRWDEEIKGFVDSAKVTLGDSEFININLMNGTSYAFENENVPSWRLRIRIWYNPLINTVIKSDEFYTYPNPVSNILSFSSEIKEVTITNSLGLHVFNSEESVKFVNMGEFSKGIYFINAITNEGLEISSKFVKID